MSGIPENIYMCHKTTDLPSFVTETWQTLNPKYKIHVFSDDKCREYILCEYGKEYADFYTCIPCGSVRADFWRLLILYKKGGIYADVDLVPLCPLSKILKDPPNHKAIYTVMGYEKTRIFQAFLACIPRHPFIRECIDEMLSHRGTWFCYNTWCGAKGMFDVFQQLWPWQKQEIVLLEEYTDTSWKECMVRIPSGINVFKSRCRGYDPNVSMFHVPWSHMFPRIRFITRNVLWHGAVWVYTMFKR